MRKSFILLSAIAGLAMVGCNSVSDYKQAEDTINYNDLERYIDDLSDDLYGGRKPFSPEEKLTVDYIAAGFKRIG